MLPIWNDCIEQMRPRLTAGDITQYFAPLYPVLRDDTLKLLAPNRYVCDHVKKNFLDHIEKTVKRLNKSIGLVQVEIGSHSSAPATTAQQANGKTVNGKATPGPGSPLDPSYTFDSHVAGSSNELARAAAQQVGEHPGRSRNYNPLFIYGGVGLGKTHLMQAAGHLIVKTNPGARVMYVSSEVFVSDMVNALKNNAMNEFKRRYRSPEALLIDDIQFLTRKDKSQEEFFHTFNTLLEGAQQIIITSDRLPNAIRDVGERLISRFNGGYAVAIDPPELETRVAIVEKKALERGVELPHDVAFFVASAIRSNIRDLEGALHSILASAGFSGRPPDVDLAREALKDRLAYQERRTSIDNIQQTVAEYYKLRVSDLLSKKRARDIARPRQMAMFLAKELTSLSLPQIGDRFGGRDHTTVLHACRRITELLQTDAKIKEDYRNLQRLFGV